MRMFVNLGNSLCPSDRPGILAEAQEKFPGRKLFILSLEGDRLLKEFRLPREAEMITVRKDGKPVNPPVVGEDDVFILNGGMSPQQAAMLVHMSEGCTVGRVVNMQRDTITTMAASCMPPRHSDVPPVGRCPHCGDKIVLLLED